MSKAVFVALRLPSLFDLQLRVYAKYEVSWADAELAVEYLRCFFDAKARQPSRLIILPQIADWAWHELIVDTARYRQVCSQVFGRFLSHIREEPDADPTRNLRAVFGQSMETMRHTYGLGVGEHEEEWLDAGWDRPRYRLRYPCPRDEKRLDVLAVQSPGSDPLADRFISWLPRRLMQRFGMSEASARRAVLEHVTCLRSLPTCDDWSGKDGDSTLRGLAWQEHILWTDRYAEDCNLLAGQFIDRRPDSPATTLVDSLPRLASLATGQESTAIMTALNAGERNVC